MKPIRLFLQQHMKKVGRKWYALPLLLLFPVAMIGLLAVIAVTFLTQEDEQVIEIGLVDRDMSEETEMVTEMIEETGQLGGLLAITSMSETEADEKIEHDEIASYIKFPDSFTDDLYQGHAVTLPVVGNPKQPTNSYMVKELLGSVSRHIRSAQANILTIDRYAKDLPMTDDQRNEFVFKQFKDFFLSTLSRDKMLHEKEVMNQATETPLHYYMLAGWFIVVTIWLLGFFLFFTDEHTERMRERLRLYGVRDIQIISAKFVSAFVISAVFAAGGLWLFQTLDVFDLYLEDIGRISGLMSLYSLSFLGGLALIETIVQAPKIRLLVQSFFTVAVLLLSGAIIPVLYFPSYIQSVLPYNFSTQAFRWVKEVILNDRFYADVIPLGMMTAAIIFLLLAVSSLKERVQS